MQTVDESGLLRAVVTGWRRAGERIAFVPTMGNLHAGHMALVKRARALADRVVVSIFVNPMQFGPAEDFDSYPRTLEQDRTALEAEGIDLLYTPTDAQLYPHGTEASTRVMVPGIGDILCGEFRPGFFTGVATVVAKLFNLVTPDVAVFGEKDYQQLIVIRRMVADLDFPIEIEPVATVREPDGLAMSSRNAYLDPAQRARAPELYRTLESVAKRLRAGERAFVELEAEGLARLEAAGFRPDYLRILRATDLEVPRPSDTRLVVLAAAWLGKARLIDNIQVVVK